MAIKWRLIQLDSKLFNHENEIIRTKIIRVSHPFVSLYIRIRIGSIDPSEYMHSHTPNNDLWHFDSYNSISKMNFIGEWIYNCNIQNTGLAVKQVRSSDINTSYSAHNHIEIDMLETFRVRDDNLFFHVWPYKYAMNTRKWPIGRSVPNKVSTWNVHYMRSIFILVGIAAVACGFSYGDYLGAQDDLWAFSSIKGLHIRSLRSLHEVSEYSILSYISLVNWTHLLILGI